MNELSLSESSDEEFRGSEIPNCKENVFSIIMLLKGIIIIN